MKKRKRYEKYMKYRRVGMAVSSFLAVYLLFFLTMHVHAAPSVLMSLSSVVYEAADDTSNPKGNLVQGNTFELNETITAENGEKWYFITMSSGVSGYIRGKVTADPENLPPVEDTSNTAKVSENQLSEEDALEAESMEDSTAGADKRAIPNNTKEKKYSLKGDINRIREQERQTEPAQDELQESLPSKIWASVDKSLMLLLFVVLLSAILICYSYKKLLQIFAISSGHPGFLWKSWPKKNKAKKRKKVKRSKRNGYRKRQKSGK